LPVKANLLKIGNKKTRRNKILPGFLCLIR